MSRASDAEILRRARAENRICATRDRDFHAHLALTSASEPPVVLLRWEGLKVFDLKELLLRVWKQVVLDYSLGVAVTVTENAIRVRRLPLVQDK